jgi:hypothetical protein
MRAPASLCLFMCSISMAQTVTISKVEIAGEKVVVHYDLDDGNPNNEYLISLYSSKDNYAAALAKVSGDVGMEVKPGTGKRIEWKIVEEYGAYKGRLALEVKGKVYVPFVKLQGFDTKKKYAKGRSHPIKWKPGSSNSVNIELYNGGERISGEINHPNSGAFNLFIPKHVKPGKEYRLKFSDPRNSEEVIYSSYFEVGPTIPLWMKIAPLVVVGTVVTILLIDKPPTSNQLPPAPGEPN